MQGGVAGAPTGFIDTTMSKMVVALWAHVACGVDPARAMRIADEIVRPGERIPSMETLALRIEECAHGRPTRESALWLPQ